MNARLSAVLQRGMGILPSKCVATLASALLSVAATSAQAFCGFYVGKADSSLFNEASQVIIARDGPRTVISMLNDYKGDLKEFALVVPVPTVLTRGQINIGDKKTFDRVDAYSSPRLAEYFDEDPCNRRMYEMARASGAPPMVAAPTSSARDKALGVTVEAQYTVGEYDIVILSATQSDGLETWLIESGYRMPPNARTALRPYINQGMKFFVAKVNLKEQAKTGFSMLRPLQFAFEHERFGLPMRLGMLNAAPDKPQDLIVYVLTRNGRVESSNYRTQKLPANMDLPVMIRPEFAKFYKAMFDQTSKKEDYKVVWTEYFWNMARCDPCAADPLTPEELRSAGVFWLNDEPSAKAPPGSPPLIPPNSRRILPPMPPGGGAQPVMLTRLHIRYTRDSLPEDLMFQETKDRENFQTRYVLRHPWKGEANKCEAARTYVAELTRRQEKEAQSLAALTGWDINAIRTQMNVNPPPNRPWWENIWGAPKS